MEDNSQQLSVFESIDQMLANNSWETVSIPDLTKDLQQIYKSDQEQFIPTIRKFPNEILAEILLELTERPLSAVLEEFSVSRFVDIFNDLESDDATDLFQELEEINKIKSQEIFSQLELGDQNEIKRLKKYSDNVAGAYMQTELFSARLSEKIEDAVARLRRLKKEGELENIHQVFITGIFNRLIAVVDLEDLIVFDFSKTFEEIVADDDKYNQITVNENQEINDVVQTFIDFDLSSISVVNKLGSLLGRITYDDVLEIIEDSATEQIYNLAGVDDEAEQENHISGAGKKRAGWLMVNLFTAIMASIVIGFFDDTITTYVSLAILMPIVASMGGNVGMQALTVTVRKLATKELELTDTAETLKKELILSSFNGLLFAITIGTMSFLWFGNYMLGVVIASAMLINLTMAGIFGALIPIGLKKFNFDPAVGSSVLLTTVTDVLGFLSFLGLAKLLM